MAGEVRSTQVVLDKCLIFWNVYAYLRSSLFYLLLTKDVTIFKSQFNWKHFLLETRNTRQPQTPFFEHFPTCTTYLNVAADHVHPFMETVFFLGFFHSSIINGKW